MNNLNNILMQHICEQIALEEQLGKEIQEQISEVDETHFGDAKKLLTETLTIINRHYVSLNETLDRLERNAASAQKTAASGNGAGMSPSSSADGAKKSISKLLRDNYAALNHITMSNTLLHTTALALKSIDVAEIALQHLKNLAPMVIGIGALVPELVTRELRSLSPSIDPLVAQVALKNTQLAWRNAG